MAYHRLFTFWNSVPPTGGGNVTYLWTPVLLGPAFVTKFQIFSNGAFFGNPPDVSAELVVAWPGSMPVPGYATFGIGAALGGHLYQQIFDDARTFNHPDDNTNELRGLRWIQSNLRFQARLHMLIYASAFHLVIGLRNRGTGNAWADGYLKVVEQVEPELLARLPLARD